jgi:putative membrane protein
LLQLLWRIRFDLALLLFKTVLVHNNWIPGGCTANESVVGIMGIAASIFLGFRNTQAIERWWEGRKLWGTDANVSRNWAGSLHAHLDGSRPPGRQERKLLASAGCHCLATELPVARQWQRDLNQLQNQLLQDLKLLNTTTLRQLEHLRSVWIGDLHLEVLTGGCGRLQQLFPTPRQHLPHNQS